MCTLRQASQLVGALRYADDIIIISPSMLRVCESYAEENSLIFNEQNTVAIKLGNNYKSICTVVLNGKQLG